MHSGACKNSDTALAIPHFVTSTQKMHEQTNGFDWCRGRWRILPLLGERAGARESQTKFITGIARRATEHRKTVAWNLISDRHGSAEETRLRRLAGARVFHLALAGDVNDLLALELMGIVAVPAIVLQNLVLHLGKNRRPIEVVGLRPAVEWMVVALRALEAGAEENLRDGFRARHGITIGAIKIRRRIQVRAAARGDQLAHKDIQRLLVRDALANPAVKRQSAFRIECPFLHAQQVRPFQGPVVGKLRTVEQLIDEPRAFVGLTAANKFARFVRSRQQAQQIEIRAPDKTSSVHSAEGFMRS